MQLVWPSRENLASYIDALERGWSPDNVRGPWKQRRGYATRALKLVLEDARAEGLRYVDIVTGPDNPALQRVIARNEGVRVEEFVTLPSLGNKSQLRYRVHLAGG